MKIEPLVIGFGCGMVAIWTVSRFAKEEALEQSF
jgi:hypothetical protein